MKDGKTSYDFFGTSYHPNAMWVSGRDRTLTSNTPFLHRLSAVPNPTETLYYQEHCSAFADRVVPVPEGCYDAPSLVVYGWHGCPFRFNVAFVDGRVDQARIRGFENPAIGRYPGYSDPDAGYQQFRCVISRGPGWQRDTLPLAPAEIRDGWTHSDSAAREDGCTDCLKPVCAELDIVG